MSGVERPHGDPRRYFNGCHCELCRRAKAKYEAMRQSDTRHGKPRLVSTLGTRRRIQALGCLGWSASAIAERMGIKRRALQQWLYQVSSVRRSTADRLAALYDEISMTPPPTDTWQQRRAVASVRTNARKKGWLPPLAWDDIDDPDEQPDMSAHDAEVDPVVVQRILDGLNPPANRAEREEVLRRWMADGRSIAALARQTGWRVERYYTPEGRAA